jgi:hypothetical protein
VRQFHCGTRLAIETGAPVVPIAVTQVLAAQGLHHQTPGIVDFSIGLRDLQCRP